MRNWKRTIGLAGACGCGSGLGAWVLIHLLLHEVPMALAAVAVWLGWLN